VTSDAGVTLLREERDGEDSLAIGDHGPPFEGLLGTDGRRHGFAEFADRRALVVIFGSNRCPTVKAYAGRMNALQRDYGSRGVQIILINSNDPHLYPDETFERMIERSAEDGYTFPYLFDAGQAVARAYGPTCTFHVFLLDQDRRLRYRGRFDDSRIPARVTTAHLAAALDEVLAGRSVTEPVTRPFGCALEIW
jgi:peroxiredoxin